MTFLLRFLRGALLGLGLLALLLLAAAATSVRLAGWFGWDLATPVVGAVRDHLDDPLFLESADLAWRGLRPELRLHGLRLGDDEAPGIQARRLAVTPALWSTLRAGELRLHRVDADGLKITVRQTADGWRVPGVAGPDADHQADHIDRLLPRYSRMRGAVVTVEFEDGAPVELGAIDLLLTRRLGEYRLGAVMGAFPGMPGNRPDGPRVAARWAAGGADDAEVFLSIPDLDLTAWEGPWSVFPVTGRAGGRVWMTLDGGTPIEILVNGRAEAVAAAPGDAVVVDSASGLAHWVGTPDHWRLDLDRLTFHRLGEEYRLGRAAVWMAPGPEGPGLAVTTEWAPLGSYAELAAAVIGPGEVADPLEAAALRGEVQARRLTVALDRERRPYALHGGLRLRGVAADPVGRLPGFHGVAADLGFQGRRVTGTVSVAEGDLRMPWLFREPLQGLTVAGEIYGAVDETGRWGLVGRDFTARNPDSAGGGRWYLQGGVDGGVDHL